MSSINGLYLCSLQFKLIFLSIVGIPSLTYYLFLKFPQEQLFCFKWMTTTLTFTLFILFLVLTRMNIVEKGRYFVPPPSVKYCPLNVYYCKLLPDFDKWQRQTSHYLFNQMHLKSNQFCRFTDWLSYNSIYHLEADLLTFSIDA